MDNLAELKAIWYTADTGSLPDAAAMLQVIKKFRSRRLRKKWMLIISAALLSILMSVVLFITPFQFVTTYIGGLMIAASGVFLAINNIRSLKRFYQLNDCSNKEFLDFIEQTRINQVYYYKKTQVILMLLCSIGLLLYLYEPATHHLLWTIAAFIATAAFLLFCWLILRPRTFKRDQDKLKELRMRIEHISNQLK